MKRFLFQTSVENAEGSQTWYVDAKNETEALQKYSNGDCDIYASEVDVTSIGQPELAGETTLDDFGDFKPPQPTQPEQKPVAEITVKNGHWIDTTGFAAVKNLADGLHKLYTTPPQPKEPEQEPVAYFNPQVKGGFYWAKPTKITAPVTVNVEPMPLYTTPPQRKPLTDEQAEALIEDLAEWSQYVEVDTAHQSLGKHVRQVLAAHGIKE
jgi:hypothetical protein